MRRELAVPLPAGTRAGVYQLMLLIALAMLQGGFQSRGPQCSASVLRWSIRSLGLGSSGVGTLIPIQALEDLQRRLRCSANAGDGKRSPAPPGIMGILGALALRWSIRSLPPGSSGMGTPIPIQALCATAMDSRRLGSCFSL